MSLRVNPNLYLDSLNALSLSQERQENTLKQMTTGLRVNSLSDDPAAAAANVGVLDQLSANDTFTRNISSITGCLDTANSVLSSAVTLLTQAMNLAVQGGNSDLSQDNRDGLAEQIDSIQSQLMGLANTTYQGAYLFSGTSTNQPFTSTGDPVNPTWAPNVTYSGGNGSTNQVEISQNQFIQINQPGGQIFNSAFTALKQASDALRTGSGDMTATVSQLQAAFQNVTTQRTFYSNALNRVQSTESFLSTDKVELTSRQNDLVGIDTTEAVANMQQAMIARQAALSASAQVNRESLLDYLK